MSEAPHGLRKTTSLATTEALAVLKGLAYLPSRLPYPTPPVQHRLSSCRRPLVLISQPGQLARTTSDRLACCVEGAFKEGIDGRADGTDGALR